MHTANTNHTSTSEVSILARVLGNGEGRLPRQIARYVLDLGFSDRDKARMHELAMRNQEDALSPAEKEELFTYAKAGSLLSILKSKARRMLGVNQLLGPKRRGQSATRGHASADRKTSARLPPVEDTPDTTLSGAKLNILADNGGAGRSDCCGAGPVLNSPAVPETLLRLACSAAIICHPAL
jgi:hypothetical protein